MAYPSGSTLAKPHADQWRNWKAEIVTVDWKP
jgi:hypothetical protein